MEELDPFEQGTHTFTGVVKTWGPGVAELVTDSGLVLFLDTHNHPAMAAGTRITVTTKKYRPCYKIMRIGLA